jgi:hypothetical protein
VNADPFGNTMTKAGPAAAVPDRALCPMAEEDIAATSAGDGDQHAADPEGRCA